MSWWDYGYQIAGMANRTTLVDNNTWNNSHIAMVRKNITVYPHNYALPETEHLQHQLHNYFYTPKRISIIKVAEAEPIFVKL